MPPAISGRSKAPSATAKPSWSSVGGAIWTIRVLRSCAALRRSDAVSRTNSLDTGESDGKSA